MGVQGQDGEAPAKGPAPSGGGSEGRSSLPEPTGAPGEDWATRFKYLLAEFDNFRRRTERERVLAAYQARAEVLRELLPLYEAIQQAHRAMSAGHAGDEIPRGLDLIGEEWKRFLARAGVEPVAVVGRPFRSDEAEAVGEAPATAEHPDGTVLEIVQQGYRFPGGLVRPAKVIVARQGGPPGEEESARASPPPVEGA